jgi:deoxycytidine triphosphate deaminase
MERLSLLSDKAILHAIEIGKVHISPFNMAHLSTSSYDVTLGRYYFREVNFFYKSDKYLKFDRRILSLDSQYIIRILKQWSVESGARKICIVL